VVKKLIPQTKNLENKRQLMAYITENSIELVQNPFGNYAIQTVMENWEASICETMFTKLRAKVA
jgi:hypothetical protein